MGSYGYAAQMQQRPTPLTSGLFKRKDWRFYRSDAPMILEKSQDRC